MRTIFRNIGSLVGILPEGKDRLLGEEMSRVGTIEDAFLVVEDGRISDFGRSGPEGGRFAPGDEVVDAHGGILMPSFCDSHTHVVYAGSREGEFLDKIEGLTYEQIAARGGGILNSSDLLHATSEEDLLAQSLRRVREMISKGTGAMEIKSGYGLSTQDELKMLRVIRDISRMVDVPVVPTLLGAHAVGRGFTREEYVDEVCREMIPAVAAQGLGSFVDVFCDRGFFTVEDLVRIMDAGKRYGMRPKIHADELESIGAVEAAVQAGALSVDHLEVAGPREIEALRGSATMPTMLPGSSFFLGIPFAPARQFISEGLAVALASDYNPGSSPSGDMRFVLALSCIRMRLTPAEALNACTINGAYAMGLSGEVGSVTRGKRANLILTLPHVKTLASIPYAYTTPFIGAVFVDGKRVEAEAQR